MSDQIPARPVTAIAPGTGDVGGLVIVTNLVLIAGSQQLIASNVFRRRLILVNESGANRATFGLDGAAVVADRGLTLGALGTTANIAGQHFWDSDAGVCPQGAITVIGTVGQAVTAIELLVP
jgi:hypothetical protein